MPWRSSSTSMLQWRSQVWEKTIHYIFIYVFSQVWEKTKHFITLQSFSNHCHTEWLTKVDNTRFGNHKCVLYLTCLCLFPASFRCKLGVFHPSRVIYQRCEQHTDFERSGWPCQKLQVRAMENGHLKHGILPALPAPVCSFTGDAYCWEICAHTQATVYCADRIPKDQAGSARHHPLLYQKLWAMSDLPGVCGKILLSPTMKKYSDELWLHIKMVK